MRSTTTDFDSVIRRLEDYRRSARKTMETTRRERSRLMAQARCETYTTAIGVVRRAIKCER